MQTPPRIDSIVMELIRGRNALAAAVVVGIAGCIPVLNVAVFGYAMECMTKFRREGRTEFDKPADWVALARQSLIIGLAFLAYCGVPWLIGQGLAFLIIRFSGLMFYPIGELLAVAGALVGLGLFGASFVVYLRSATWEALLQVKEISKLAVSMTSAVWLPVVFIYGLASITASFWGFGLFLGLFVYCFYLGEICRKLSSE